MPAGTRELTGESLSPLLIPAGITTATPSDASARVIAAPMPAVLPVTRARFPGTSRSIGVRYRTTLMLNVSVPNCFHNDIHSGM